jgi:anthranilate phosphoribosyltransferase
MTTPPREPGWPALLRALVGGSDLNAAEATWAMSEIMSGAASAAQIGAFAAALRAKGETAAEIAGMAEAMLRRTRTVCVPGPAVDVVGTGGDGADTVNISTMAALVTAGAGVPVVKHGNRAASSRSGTADVLEELGVAIDLAPAAVSRCVADVGIGFCFAASYHPALRHTAAPRRELGIPTAFNILGPLTNPAQPGAGLIGCANARLAPVLAEVFARRGSTVLVVRGDDGLDELTTTTTTSCWLAAGQEVRAVTVEPQSLGIAVIDAEALRGGDAAFNARVVRELLGGHGGDEGRASIAASGASEELSEPGVDHRRRAIREAVALNAAGAIASAAGFSPDLDAALQTGLERAERALDSGAAARVLEQWVALSNRLARHG